MGKKLTALLRHNSPLKNYMCPNGAVELSHVLDHCGKHANAFEQFKFGRYFAAFIQGNNKQRYFVEVELKDDWFLSTDRLPWKIFIGCNQGHSTGFVRPMENSHKLTPAELQCFGWIFHVTDQRFVRSIRQNGLKRYNRDTLHFMYDNDGSDGYIRKGRGTKAPRQYESTRYCILKTHKLVQDGFDLFLTSNGVILIYDDLPCDYFEIVDQFPYLGYNFASRTSGHGLPPEIKVGVWRGKMTAREEYEEYLSSNEISEYLEDGRLVEYRLVRKPFPKGRSTAWEFMGQEVPENYSKLLNNFCEERRYPAACVDGRYGTSSSASAGAVVPEPAEASTGSAPAEVVDVEAELSTLNKLEVQAVQIISENPWHLFQAGVMTLRNNKGERVTNPHGEPVLIVREYFMLSTSQQEDLRAQGITRHVWEKYPLAGHAVLFFTRSWEIGRMTAYVTNYHTDEEKEIYQQKLQYFEHIGWRRDVPMPYKAREGDNNPASLERERIEKEEDDRDEQELRMFGLFAEAVEDLYTGIVERYVRKTPALWEEFAMKLENGNWYLVDPDPTAGTPTVPTEHNLCLDIHNNLRFSPRLCLWAVDRKLESTYEKPAPGTFAGFALKELRQYAESRSDLHDDFYKRLVINTQTRTFEDVNYVNSIGSKVVIRPLAETFEISAKKDLQLQRTIVLLDPASASKDAMATGDSPPGEIPEAKQEAVAADSPSGEMAVAAAAAAEVPEDLPSGRRSRTEAKEEDVEMDAPAEELKEETPQEDPQDAKMPAAKEAPDFGDVDLDDDVSETSSQKMQRANLLMNSDVLQQYAYSSDEEEGESRLGPRPRIAHPAMARFISQFLQGDRDFLDAVLEADNERRQRRHEEGIPFTEIQPREEVRYGEELKERKAQDIFSHASTQDFTAALKPEADENISSAQSSLELHLCDGREHYQRLPTRCHFLNRWNLNQRSRLRFQSHNAQKIL